MKKLFGIMALAAIAAAAGWNFSQSQNKMELSDLALANINGLVVNLVIKTVHRDVLKVCFIIIHLFLFYTK